MSHFVVLVIGPHVDRQLAPFCEDLEHPGVTPERIDVTEERRHQYENLSTARVKLPDGTLDAPWSEAAWIDPLDHAKGKHEEVEVPFKQMYATFEAFVEDWHSEEVAEDGTVGYETNPRAKWDWYQVGGRWTGYFKLKEGATGKLGEPGCMTEASKPGYADIVYKRDIDLHGMRMEAEEEAGKQWDKVHAVIDGHDWKVWRDVLALFPGNIDGARDFYQAQDAVTAVRKAQDTIGFIWELDVYHCTRAEFVKRARDNALVPYAILKDGEWYQKGEMGWWGMSRDEVSQDEWNEKVNALLDELPDSTILTAVDCHI